MLVVFESKFPNPKRTPKQKLTERFRVKVSVSLSLDPKLLREIEISLKENFKLSSYESKAYLTLIKRGRQTPKELSSAANVPAPRIYDTLESLMSKGFVVKQQESYSSIPPKQALRGRTAQFEAQFSQEQARRRDAEAQLTSQLENSYSKSEVSGEISILKGLNSIANKFNELVENSHDIVLVAKRAIEAKEIFIPILSEYAGEKNGKRIKIIAPGTAKITREEVQRAKKANAEIRKSDHVIFDMMITDTDDVIIGVPDPFSDEINHAIAIWLRNPSFANSTKKALEDLWESAERT